MSASDGPLGPLGDLVDADLHTLPLDVGGTPRTCLLALPRRLASDPALLVNVYSDARAAITQPQVLEAPLAFLDAGHAVAAIDVPGHGALLDAFGKGLNGIAASLAAGIDVFASLRVCGRAAIDAGLARGVGRPGRVYTAGASRGGLAALHLLAGDDRVAAAALTCPVTYLPALREFTGQAGWPLAEQNSALALVPRIGGRPVWMSINHDDRRVSTARCREFFDALRAVQRAHTGSILELCDGEDHYLPDEAYVRGARWLVAQASAG